MTGSAKITPAFSLPSKYVIHAVGPIYAASRRKREGLERELLAGAYRTSLELAAEVGDREEDEEAEEEEDGEGDEGISMGEEGRGASVAFSCLSTGIYGYPSAEAAEIACQVVREFLEEQEKEGKGGVARVIFCCFLEKDVVAYSEALPRYFPPTQEDIEAAAAAAGAGEGEGEGEESHEHAHTDEHGETELGKEDWVPVEKPQDAMEKSAEIVEKPGEVEGMERSEVISEGEKIEGADVSEGEGVEVDVPTGIGGNPATHSLLKDW